MSDDGQVYVGITGDDSGLVQAFEHARQTVESGAEGIKGSVEGIGESFTRLAEIVGVAFSAEAFKEWIGGALEAAEQAEHLSMSLGVTTETVQTLSYAAGLTGSSLETATAAMVRLERSASIASDATTKQAAAFRDLGIDSTQLAQLLQNPDELLKTVTADLAKFTDGANKNAVGIELMGRSFATNAALFKELGLNYEELTQHATALGIVLSDTDEKALAEAQRGFNDLGQQVKGLGNQMAIELLPAINSVREGLASLLSSGELRSGLSDVAAAFNQIIILAGQAKSALHVDTGAMGWTDFIGDIANVGRAFVNLDLFARNFFVQLALDSESTWVDFQNDVKDAVHVAEADLAGMLDALSKSLASISPEASVGLKQLADSLLATSNDFTYATVNVNKYVEAQEANAHAAFENKIAIDQWADGIRNSATALGEVSDKTDAATQKLGPLDDGLKKSQAAAAALAQELTKWDVQMDELAAKSAGPYDAANLQYLATITKLNDEIVTMIGNGLSLADAEEKDAQATDLATAAMWNSIAADLAKHDAIDSWYQKLVDSTNQLGLLTNAQKASAEFDAIATKNLLDNRDAQGLWHASAEEAIAANAAMKQGYVDAGAAVMDYGQQMKQSQAMLHEWAGTLENDAMGAFNAFLTDLEQGKSVMKDVEGAFTNLVNQILAEAFKLEVVGPIVNSIFGLSGTAGALPTGNIAQGALGQLLGGSGQGVGGNLLGGLLGGGGGVGSVETGIFAPGGLLGGGQALAGAPIEGAADAGVTGGLSAGALGAAFGGALAGYQMAGPAGALALGTAAYFIPVVGWIAAAASLINQFTGGGLFGTDAKPYGSEENLSVGASGANISALIDEKGKKGLFQGSYYKTQSTPVDQQTQDGVAAFFTGLQTAANNEAQAFGMSTGEIVAGTFHETFDKAGKMLTEVSTVAGQNFSESIQDFQNRILGDTLLKNMGDASAEAQKIAEQWQSSASALLAGAEFLSQAQLDISQGHGLAVGDTLTQLTAFMQQMAGSGETLIQTYVRLSAETQDVQAILFNLGLDTGKTGEALVKFDDDMTKAAGSLDNLNTLWNDYYKEFYSASEQQAITVKGLQTTVNADFAAIGQDPSESMAQFRANFEAAMPNLTAQQIVSWLEAGDALYKLDNAIGATDNAAATAAQNMFDSAAKVVSSIQQIETEAQSLSTSLFGSNLDQLKAQQAAYGDDTFAIPFKLALQPAIDAAQKQQDAAAHLGDASKLLNDFATISAVSGQSLAQIAAQDHAPLDKLAQFLGTDATGLQAQFAQDVAIATASLNIEANTKAGAEYLQDIRDILAGKSPTFTASDLQNASAGVDPSKAAASTSKGGAGTANPITSPDVVAAITNTSADSTDILSRMLDALHTLVGIRGSSPPPDNRFSRNVVARQ
jgi:hypothetical protein